MKKLLTIILVLSLISVGGAPVSAATIDKTHMIGGEEYTLTYDIGESENLSSVSVDGEIERQNVDESETQIDVTVSANEVESESDGRIFVVTSDSQYQTDVTVFQSPSTQEEQETTSNIEQKAERYDEISDTWVQQRTNRVETSDGTLTVFEQRDPTRGPIDEESGVPEGEWVQVDVDENGEPIWLYDSPEEAMIYMSERANTRYSERIRWVIGSISIVVISLVTQFAILPRYRKKKEEDFMYGGN